MNRYLFIFISLFMCSVLLLSFSSCSLVTKTIDAKLDDMGLSNEGDMLKDAWEDIGKEALDGAVDDVLCGLEFRDQIIWPSDGVALSIPKPYYTKLSSVSDTGEKGTIVIDSFTKYELRKYIELLSSEGFEKYSDTEPVVYVHVENGTAVCPIYDSDNERLKLLYAEGFAEMVLTLREMNY